jgi:hypothetical protein
VTVKLSLICNLIKNIVSPSSALSEECRLVLYAIDGGLRPIEF